jgi:predicted metal-dependent phosphotriesterase family hydrolase
MIRTVTGDIDAKALGFCQCHEHLFIERCQSFEIAPVLFMDDVEKSSAELSLYRSCGGQSLVDAQPVLAGRMAEHLMTASERTGVNIVAVTGFHKTVFYKEDSYIFHDSAQKIAELYITEVEQGMLSSMGAGAQRLTCKAGLIKVAVDRGGIRADATVEKLFEAAAHAALETGTALLCHVEKGADGLEILSFFADRGIPSDRVILCHLDRARYDAGYHKACLETGAFLEYDTINRLKYHDDQKEADLICAMVEKGFIGQLLLGLDTTRARLHSYGGEMGLDYIIKTFVPYLLQRGVGNEDCEKMLVANPQVALRMKKERINV